MRVDRSVGCQVGGLTGRCRVRTIVPLYPCTPSPPPPSTVPCLPCAAPRCRVPCLPSAGGEGPGFQGSKVPLSRRSRPPSLPGLVAVPSRSLLALDRPLDWTPPGIPLTTADHLLGIYPPVTSPRPFGRQTQVVQDFNHAFFISLQPSSPRLSSLVLLTHSLPSLFSFLQSSILEPFLHRAIGHRHSFLLSSLRHWAPFLISPLFPHRSNIITGIAHSLATSPDLDSHHDIITVEATGL